MKNPIITTSPFNLKLNTPQFFYKTANKDFVCTGVVARCINGANIASFIQAAVGWTNPNYADLLRHQDFQLQEIGDTQTTYNGSQFEQKGTIIPANSALFGLSDGLTQNNQVLQAEIDILGYYL